MAKTLPPQRFFRNWNLQTQTFRSETLMKSPLATNLQLRLRRLSAAAQNDSEQVCVINFSFQTSQVWSCNFQLNVLWAGVATTKRFSLNPYCETGLWVKARVENKKHVYFNLHFSTFPIVFLWQNRWLIVPAAMTTHASLGSISSPFRSFLSFSRASQKWKTFFSEQISKWELIFAWSIFNEPLNSKVWKIDLWPRNCMVL